MADEATPLRKAADPLTDGSGGWMPPVLDYGMRFRDYGSLGLRQYSGWVREEFLPELIGRQAARTYREMIDNSAIVGAMLFAIEQAMRKVEWRVDPANDSGEAKRMAEFVDECRDDMSNTWEDTITEILSMLGFGFSVHEIVYKRRLGPQPAFTQKLFNPNIGFDVEKELPGSKFNDGKIGWRRLPIRGQETLLKWFFDSNGQIRGVTQQPWVGVLIDIPIEKMLLFRPKQHKNNPEGRSVLRTAYRSYYLIKRLEELEAILFERMGGFPVIYCPSSLIDKAAGSGNTPDVAAAKASYQMLKNIVTNVRVDEQMGAIFPSDPWTDADGKLTNTRMFEFKLETPQHGRQSTNPDQAIQRHSLNMLMTLLADFLHMGHEGAGNAVRGTNNLAVTKVDMFYQALEGWMNMIASVFNRYAVPRLFEMNGFSRDLEPQLIPDMPQRLDLDSLGAFIKNVSASGMLIPDEDLDQWIRDAAGMPDIDPDSARETPQMMMANAANQPPEAATDTGATDTGSVDKLRKQLLATAARHIKAQRKAA